MDSTAGQSPLVPVRLLRPSSSFALCSPDRYRGPKQGARSKSMAGSSTVHSLVASHPAGRSRASGVAEAEAETEAEAEKEAGGWGGWRSRSTSPLLFAPRFGLGICIGPRLAGYRTKRVPVVSVSMLSSAMHCRPQCRSCKCAQRVDVVWKNTVPAAQ